MFRKDLESSKVAENRLEAMPKSKGDLIVKEPLPQHEKLTNSQHPTHISVSVIPLIVAFGCVGFLMFLVVNRANFPLEGYGVFAVIICLPIALWFSFATPSEDFSNPSKKQSGETNIDAVGTVKFVQIRLGLSGAQAFAVTVLALVLTWAIVMSWMQYQSHARLQRNISNDIINTEQNDRLGAIRTTLNNRRKQLLMDDLPLQVKETRLTELQILERAYQDFGAQDFQNVVNRLSGDHFQFPESWLLRSRAFLRLGEIQDARHDVECVFRDIPGMSTIHCEAVLILVDIEQTEESPGIGMQQLDRIIDYLDRRSDEPSHSVLVEALVARSIVRIANRDVELALRDLRIAGRTLRERIENPRQYAHLFTQVVALVHEVLLHDIDSRGDASRVSDLKELIASLEGKIGRELAIEDMHFVLEAVVVHAIYSMQEGSIELSKDEVERVHQLITALRAENVVGERAMAAVRTLRTTIELREACTADVISTISSLRGAVDSTKKTIASTPFTSPEYSLFNNLVGGYTASILILAERASLGREITHDLFNECVEHLSKVKHRTMNSKENLAELRSNFSGWDTNSERLQGFRNDIARLFNEIDRIEKIPLMTVPGVITDGGDGTVIEHNERNEVATNSELR